MDGVQLSRAMQETGEVGSANFRNMFRKLGLRGMFVIFLCFQGAHPSQTHACKTDDMKLIPLVTALPYACKSDFPEKRGRAGPEVSHFVARPSCWLLGEVSRLGVFSRKNQPNRYPAYVGCLRSVLYDHLPRGVEVRHCAADPHCQRIPRPNDHFGSCTLCKLFSLLRYARSCHFSSSWLEVSCQRAAR